MKEVYAFSITKNGETIEFEIGSYDDAVSFTGFCLDSLISFDTGEITINITKRASKYE